MSRGGNRNPKRSIKANSKISCRAKPASALLSYPDNSINPDFPFEIKLSWDAFLGSLSTASFAPDEGSSLYVQFERDAKSVFDAFNIDHQIEMQGVTELYLGQIP